jgi:hypothetical protein
MTKILKNANGNFLRNCNIFTGIFIETFVVCKKIFEVGREIF